MKTHENTEFIENLTFQQVKKQTLQKPETTHHYLVLDNGKQIWKTAKTKEELERMGWHVIGRLKQ